MASLDDIMQYLNTPTAQTGLGMLGSTQTPGPAYQAAAAAAQQQQQSQQMLAAQRFALQQAQARASFNPSQYLLQNEAANASPQAAGAATQQALGATPGGAAIAGNTQTPYQAPQGAIGNVDFQGMLGAGLQAGMSPEEVQAMQMAMDPRTAIMMKNMTQPSVVVPPGAVLANPGLAMNQAIQGGSQGGAQGGALFTNPNPPADSPVSQLQQLQAARARVPDGTPAAQQLDSLIQKQTGSWEQGNQDDINTVADAIGHYEMAPLNGSAMRSPISQRVMAAVSKNYPNYNAQNYTSSQAASDSFAAGPLGDKVRSMNVAINHLDVLKDAATALGNGDMKAYNAARQEYLQQTGSPIPTNFDTVHQIVANEVVKAVSGASGGTQSERDEMKQNIDKASSFTQLQGSIGQAQKLLGGQLNGLAKQYQGATNGRRDFAQRYLSERTQKVVGTGTGEGGASEEPTNAQSGGFALPALQQELVRRGLIKQ